MFISIVSLIHDKSMMWYRKRVREAGSWSRIFHCQTFWDRVWIYGKFVSDSLEWLRLLHLPLAFKREKRCSDKRNEWYFYQSITVDFFRRFQAMPVSELSISPWLTEECNIIYAAPLFIACFLILSPLFFHYAIKDALICRKEPKLPHLLEMVQKLSSTNLLAPLYFWLFSGPHIKPPKNIS